MTSCVQIYIDGRSRGYELLHEGEQEDNCNKKVAAYQVIKFNDDQIDKLRIKYEDWLRDGGRWPCIGDVK